MLLALDTTDGICNVGISSGNAILGFSQVSIYRGTSEIIFPQIEKTLTQAHIDLHELSGFVVCTGPGNYTSLRIAISAVRGMALACGKPSVGINLFELLAPEKRPALAIVKGPVGKVYVQELSLETFPNRPLLTYVEKVKKRQDLKDFTISGHKAEEIAQAVGGNHLALTNKKKMKNLIELGLSRIKEDKKRPAPLYIK